MPESRSRCRRWQHPREHLGRAVLGWIGTRALQSQLYAVPALDPWSWTGALLVLAMVLVMAVFRPAEVTRGEME